MANNSRPGIILYKDWYPALRNLSKEQAGRLLFACLLADEETPDFRDDPVLNMAWAFVAPRLEEDLERYAAKLEQTKEAGRRSAERRKAAEANDRQRPSTTVNDRQRQSTTVNDRQPTTATTTTTTSTTTPAKEGRPTAPERHRYGIYANVLLSDDEYRKIREEFPKDWEKKINRLSEYMKSKGASYKDHLATIRAWARRDGPVQTQQPGAGRMMDVDEMDAIAAIMKRK